jgi:hypothetical protein
LIRNLTASDSYRKIAIALIDDCSALLALSAVPDSYPFGHAETEIVTVWIRDRKLAQSPRLINWCGVNRRLRPQCCVQTPRAKGRVTLINVVHKHTIDRTEDPVPGMMGKLEFSPVTNQINDSVGHLAVFLSRPFVLEVEDFGVEV